MHERSLAGIAPRPPPAVEFTSFIYRIFGGRIRSQVKCKQCGYESNTYDPFLDLSLEITHASSVEAALQRFTAGEVLDGSNKYKCPHEGRGVRAVKRMTVEAAPPVLVVQLKRFEFSLSGRKISKPVSFEETLDLGAAMSRRQPAVYDLYGVLVHQGHSMHSGHYYCFVKGAGGEWHKCDDQRVHTTSLRSVLGQHPYMLFYIRRQPGAPSPAPAPQGRNAFGPAQAAAAGSLLAPPPEEDEPRAKKPKRKQQPGGSLADGIAAVAAGSAKRKQPDPPAPAPASAAPLAPKRQKPDALAQRQRQQRVEQQEAEAELAAAVAAAEAEAAAAAAAGSSSRPAKRAKRSAEAPPPPSLPRCAPGRLGLLDDWVEA
jgi:ubiquitin carboxyl-terminal hydrolase 36/42